tara:strand:- start:395 stop:565 length:171 start_codon:yes stop_codon:yes gene_type:complete
MECDKGKRRVAPISEIERFTVIECDAEWGHMGLRDVYWSHDIVNIPTTINNKKRRV